MLTFISKHLKQPAALPLVSKQAKQCLQTQGFVCPLKLLEFLVQGNFPVTISAIEKWESNHLLGT